MKQFVIYTTMLMALLIALNLPAVNQMNIMTTITGDFNGSTMGWSLASIDFNGDGIKDLVALERGWNPTGSYHSDQMYGRIYFYWGGAGFDNIPDFSITGSVNIQYGFGQIFNGGDVNGDGIEDLGVVAMGSQHLIQIFYGRENPSATPDFQIPYPLNTYDSVLIKPLGDINHDGLDDIGEIVTNTGSISSVNIIMGGSQNIVHLYDVHSWVGLGLNGIGDVNNDGIDDYHTTYPLVYNNNTQYRLSIYYGNNTFPDLDSLVICPNTNSVIDLQAAALGDVNGDGTDDFLSFINNGDGKIWFGGQNLSTQWNVQLTDSSIRSAAGEVVSHGDINNDGYEDFIGTEYGYGGDDGIAYIWLGSSEFNGIPDLILPAPQGISEQFGWAKATGDFDNDGFCDIAVSQPFADPSPLRTPGRIHVYAGNTHLNDTTPNEDNVVPLPEDNLWAVNIYPNPLPRGNTALNIDFRGEGYSKIRKLTVALYNLKGQKVSTYKISTADRQLKSWTGNLKHLPAGEYFVSVSDNNHKLTTKSITIQ